MSAPPPRLNLTAEDLPGAPAWIEPLLGKLNAFSGPVGDALSRGITFRENFAGQVLTVTINVPDEWVPVTLANGWSLFGAAQFGKNAAVRYTSSRGDVEARGLIKRAAGTPAVGSTVFALGAPWKPASDGDRRMVVEAAGAPGALEVVPAGTVNYLFGSTGFMDLSGCKWVAGNPNLRWAKSINVTLGSPGSPYPGNVAYVLPLCVQSSTSKVVTDIATGVDWELGPPVQNGQGSMSPVLVIHRVSGLLPNRSYRVTFLVLSE